jgi:putative ABC transport system permease protein
MTPPSRCRSAGHSLSSWLDTLRADAVLGWRQLRAHPRSSAAAILSLGLALGACVSAFRIIDAMLWRPLPVAGAERLFVLVRSTAAFGGAMRDYDGSEYPLFERLRVAAGRDAELLALSYVDRVDLTYRSDDETEKAHRQYVSGRTFETFGLRPALGRLLTDRDDRSPGAHPVAVLSHDYWTRRFNRDAGVIGRTFHMGRDTFEIVGVAEPRFTGVEPGTFVDVFVPTMMAPPVTREDASWFRTWLRLQPGVAEEPLAARLQAVVTGFLQQRAKGFTDMPPQEIQRFVQEKVRLEPASAGRSELQRGHRQALAVLGALVTLVLLVACANVANLMAAQASSRARELAVRVSIGAAPWRLVQLVLVASAWIAGAASVLGASFAWWAAPLVVGLINPSDNPARLVLPADWRLLAFGVVATVVVTVLFGLPPALRASAVAPLTGLRGGADRRARRGLTHALIAGQVAFCVLVVFLAGLLVATFARLSHQPTGFSSDGVVALETVAKPARPPAAWNVVAERLRALPGVEAVALADQALLVNDATNSFLSIDGAPPTRTLAFFREVSPGWLDVMRIPLIDGRDLAAGDTTPGVAIVNEMFAKTFFAGKNPVGRSFVRASGGQPHRIVALIRDVRYRSLREPILPIAFVPFQHVSATGTLQDRGWGTFLVRTRTAGDPLALAPALRGTVGRAQPGFRVSTIRTQASLIEQHTVRERLLAMLAAFFAAVALALAGIGLYGVLDHSVQQGQRELGIRLAIGARASEIARRVTLPIFTVVLAGTAVGLGLGFAAGRAMEALFYQVHTTEWAMVVIPTGVILAVALLASVPPVIRALRIDPLAMLRAD